ncbi:MAG: LLM class flavin-dependent oxidoreductase [Acidimicrobiales bacterium]|nr:LLM class flavin-dependent oxidoreductase [Acidimicrobiales bacterium]
MDLSVAFATGPDTPDHVALAERLGFERAWLYDSPALYPDVWVTLALAAERTGRIGLGPAVLIPSLRHPMTTAAAVATVERLAPGRLAVAVGTGFTGRMCLGQRPLPWASVQAYVVAVRGLLRGDDVEWEGALMRMMHPPGFAPGRPIEVPILLGADGPKGQQLAHELADGVFSTAPVGGFAWSALLTSGTVLDPGEDPGSQRALAAAGPVLGAGIHLLYERGNPLVEALPGGAAWKADIDALPDRTRHLELHALHMVGLQERDRAMVSGDLARAFTLTGTLDQLRERLAGLELSGVTEVAWQPAGPDIPGELERFAALLG